MLVCTMNFMSFLVLALIFYFSGMYMLYMDTALFMEFNLLSINSVSFSVVFYFDWVSFFFMSCVLFISSMIIKYSEEYMAGDKKIKRFIFLMLLFVASMMLMVSSLNLVSILLGWDGLGLVSYALVIYYQNVKSFNAGMLTALSNRIGDAALLMSIFCLASEGSWNFFNYLESMKNDWMMMVISVFIVLAAITKSAQIPFSSWLPAAMAAPTPVSSLVHSSTLVTAGVYLLIRFSYLMTESVLSFLLVLSLLTMFMAGLAANFEYDLKKIIALSTLSQLGMMITILSLGGFNLAYFHLLIHAFFKALLFMCAGAIIHNLGSNQDIRNMGSMSKFLPVTSTCMSISNFALCGIPFISGFYSKDLIAEILSMNFLSMLVYIIFFISIGLTVSYTLRLNYYLFFSKFNGFCLVYFSDNNNIVMMKGMAGLIILVVVKGSILLWYISITPDFSFLPFFMKTITISCILLGIWFGYLLAVFLYYWEVKAFLFKKITKFISMMWNLPILSTFGLNSYFLNLGKKFFKNFDHGWLEFYGSKGLSFILSFLSKFFHIILRNHLKLFLLFMFFFLLLMMGLYLI
uniref:NADH-ubiquinone oxidoreductase chain 5 n=1 Tax=Ceratopus sp. CG351 TaxID=2480753 RepID=A0A3G2JZF5_9CUCU|nr:NADH dehydrogenase subunit 5 [Ceratopus sp. CG351]